ncbi:MAG: class I SAM-dependent methyltransferase [Anaerolineae bacterium]
MNVNRAFHEENRRSWNAATAAHDTHRGDQAAFYRTGGSTLFPEERELLGDLRGQTVVHLQCNAGQDTLSLVQEGAASVIGVDISDTAIELARKLSADTGIPARFVRSDVYDWLAGTNERFDTAFLSYGALVWLTDLQEWARGVFRVLKPGGRVVAVEYHPVFHMFEEGWVLAYPGLGGTPHRFETGVVDYLAEAGDTPSGFEAGVVEFRNPYATFEHNWGVGDIVGALLDTGLRLTSLREYPYSNGLKRYDMRPLPSLRFAMPEGMPDIPLMLSFVAEKPGDA